MLRDPIRKIHCKHANSQKPTAGKQDHWVPCDHAAKLRDLIGGQSEVVLVEDAGHLIQLDQPERLMAELVLFLTKVDEASRE